MVNLISKRLSAPQGVEENFNSQWKVRHPIETENSRTRRLYTQYGTAVLYQQAVWFRSNLRMPSTTIPRRFASETETEHWQCITVAPGDNRPADFQLLTHSRRNLSNIENALLARFNQTRYSMVISLNGSRYSINVLVFRIDENSRVNTTQIFVFGQ